MSFKTIKHIKLSQNRKTPLDLPSILLYNHIKIKLFMLNIYVVSFAFKCYNVLNKLVTQNVLFIYHVYHYQ